MQALEEGEIEEALKALYEVDNNCYAFLFDEEVYYHFTEYILHQPKAPPVLLETQSGALVQDVLDFDR